MGKSDTCAAEGCNHTSRGLCSFFFFPMHNPWRTLWIEAVGREPELVNGTLVPWQPTTWDRLCSCHFSNPPNPKSRRQDAKWVVPDKFVRSQPYNEEDYADQQDSVSTALMEITQSRSAIPESIGEPIQPPSKDVIALMKCPKEPKVEKKSAKIVPQSKTLAEILSTPTQVSKGKNKARISPDAPAKEAKEIKSKLLKEFPSIPLTQPEPIHSMGTMKMLSHSEQQSIMLEALRSEIVSLCQNFLHFESDVSVEGLLGITVDSKHVMLLNVKESIAASHGTQPVYEEPSEFPVIKIEPEAPEDDISAHLQSEIHAAHSSASISSLSSKIVDMVDDITPSGEANDSSDFSPDSDEGSDYESPPHRKRRRRFTMDEKLKAVEMIVKDKHSLSYVSNMKKVPMVTLQGWHKSYSTIIERGKPFENGQHLDDMLSEYYMQCESAGVHCPDTQLLKKAKQLARNLDCKSIKTDAEFISAWKHRCFKRQSDPAYETLSKKIRTFSKTLYEEGRECSLDLLTGRVKAVASGSPITSDPDWLHKWKMHYFSDHSSQDTNL